MDCEEEEDVKVIYHPGTNELTESNYARTRCRNATAAEETEGPPSALRGCREHRCFGPRRRMIYGLANLFLAGFD